MAWFKCGGGGIPAALKSLMNAVLNKKWGTSGTYPPETWPETVNLMGPLEEKTVSGSVVAFSDGADDVPLKKCVVTIPANLTGVSSVGVVSGGKNLFDGWTKGYGINTTTGEIQNNNNGAISGYIPVKENADYYISGLTNTLRSFIAYYKSDRTFISRTNGNDKLFFALTTPAECAFIIVYQYVVSSSTGTIDDIDNLQTQVEYGTQGTTYKQYIEPATHTAALGRTIYGGTADIVNGAGNNNYSGVVALNSLSWAKTTISGHDAFYATLPNGYLPTGSSGFDGACDSYEVTQDITLGTDKTIRFYYNSNYNFSRCIIRDDTYATATANEFKQAVQGNIVYRLNDNSSEPFTFTPVPVNSLLDNNTLWSDDGDLEVVYRSTGTETIITPTLVTKAITENGTYNAASDNADGYSSVTVEVPAGPSNIETVLGSGVLIEVAGVSGTDVSRTMWTRTAAQDEKVVFHPNTQVKTNTGANDGYFKVLKNGVVVVSTYANTSTTTSFSIPDIDLEAGDVLTISVGFDNYHTSAWFDIWSTITILSSGSAPVLGLGLGNPGAVNEPEEEEPDAAPDEIQEETPEEVDQNESNE